MKASELAGSAVQVGVLVAGLVMLIAEGALFLFGLVLGVGCVAWYAGKGLYLTGRTGHSEAQIQASLQGVESALEQLGTLPDSPENRQKRHRLDRQRRRLCQRLGGSQEH